MGILNRDWLTKDENDKLPFKDARLMTLDFYNNTDKPKRLWIEPTCVEVELDRESEFKLASRDDSYGIKLEEECINLYLNYTWDFQLYKRPVSDKVPNPNEWVLVEDYAEARQ